jgi:hypothetical protein
MKKTMFTILIICSMGWLEGCSTNTRVAEEPTFTSQTLVLDKKIQPLTRMEQIDAIKECQEVNLRPRLVYGKRMVNGVSSEIVLDVICANKYAF